MLYLNIPKKYLQIEEFEFDEYCIWYDMGFAAYACNVGKIYLNHLAENMFDVAKNDGHLIDIGTNCKILKPRYDKILNSLEFMCQFLSDTELKDKSIEYITSKLDFYQDKHPEVNKWCNSEIHPMIYEYDVYKIFIDVSCKRICNLVKRIKRMKGLSFKLAINKNNEITREITRNSDFELTQFSENG